MIGRYKERVKFDKLVAAERSEFVVIYGRRRIGKTYLIRNHFGNKLFFQHTGIADASMKIQLQNFTNSLQKGSSKKLETPDNWLDAFFQLQRKIESSKLKKKIIFIDELPWMDSPRSNFLPALEHFWNGWASARKDILLIICGSATSYLVKNIFGHKGGLHNRVTQKIKLEPFTLNETREFLESKKINWTNYQICKIYMAMGGIPYYLEAIKKGQSPDQAIDELFFDTDGLLFHEFNHLYASLFKNADKYIEIITALAKKNKGLTREEIAASVSTKNGGTLTKILEDLALSHFINKYVPYAKKSRNSLYQLTDFYSLFYFKFIADKKVKKGDWLNAIDNPKQRAWSGFAFEQLCIAHLEQIKMELGISGVQTNESSWRSTTPINGAQIDLVLERRDQIIHLFEMKFSMGEYTIDKKYAAELNNKVAAFKTETKTRSAVWLCMITTHGIATNMYAYTAPNNLTMDCLFTAK